MHKCLLPAVTAVALVAGGCASSGFSPRESSGRDVTAYMSAVELRPQSNVMNDLTASGDRSSAKPIQLPASIAVAQVGEVAPSDEMLEALENEPALFSNVQPIGGTTPLQQYRSSDVVGNHLDKMVGLARNVGADYLVVYGGTIDQYDRREPWRVLDLAILPAFVLPSNKLTADARSSAFILETSSGRLVGTTSAASSDSTWSSTVALRGKGVDQMRHLRDETVEELTGRLITRFKTAAGQAASGAGAPSDETIAAR